MKSFIENVNYVAGLDNLYGSEIELYKNNLSLKSVQHDIELKFSYYNNDDKKIHSIVHSAPGVVVSEINDTLLSFKTLVESLITGSEFTCVVNFVINSISIVNINIVSNSDTYKTYELEMKVVTAGAVTYDVFGEVKNSLKILPSLARITTSDIDAIRNIPSQVETINNSLLEISSMSADVNNNTTIVIQAKDIAVSSSSSALSSANIATTKANEASTSASSALSSKDSATASATSASASATSASTSATSALSSKNAASTSETNALASKNAAATSATNAAASSASATTSATSAATSATTATTKANEASASATSASTSATNASASFSAATTKATEASSSATSALASKNAASTSETNALASKNAAATSARDAAVSASEASTSASNAALSATDSENNAIISSVSATRATTKASEALASEISASTSASTATTQATNAATSETNALASKNAAATSARDASVSVTAASISATNSANSAASAAASAASAASAAAIVGGNISLDSLNNVTAPTPANGDILSYVTATTDWRPLSILPVSKGGTGTTTSTGSGNNVLSTSPTLVTPDIGVATGTSFNGITGLGTNTPVMNGTATAGISTLASKQDHIHPSDTTKQNVLVSGTNIKTVNGVSVLGSGNISTVDSTKLALSGGTMTGAITAIRETKVAMGTNDINLATGNLFTKTISGATTLTISNALADGNVNSFVLELTNGGSAVITWFSGVKWAGGIAPTLTASGKDILGFYSHDGGTTWNILGVNKDVK